MRGRMTKIVKLVLLFSLTIQLFFTGWGPKSEMISANSGPGIVPNRIASTSLFTVFLQTNGTVKVAGVGAHVLGLGHISQATYSTAKDIPGLTNVKEVTANSSSVFALLHDGTVKGWGSSAANLPQFGSSATPASIPFLSNIAKIAAGDNFVAALSADGLVYTWGDNTNYQLGRFNTATPIQAIPGLTNVKDIAVGSSFMLALMEDGTVKSWGNNASGQLGIGHTTSQLTPVTIPTLSNVTALAAGANSALALLGNGNVMSWGLNENGQLGIGDNSPKYVPTTISGLSSITHIEAGSNHFWASARDGKVYGWGYNSRYQLGNKSTTAQFTPMLYKPFEYVTTVYAGHSTSYFIDVNNQVWALGFNGNFQLGLGDSTDRDKATQVAGINISSTPLMLEIEKQSYSFESNPFSSNTVMWDNGKLHVTGKNSVPKLDPDLTERDLQGMRYVPHLEEFKQLSISAGHALGLTADGRVKAWGYSSSGQLGLGDGGSDPVTEPTLIPSLQGVQKVFAANGFSMALLQSGKVAVWGTNSLSQLGLNDKTKRTVPVEIPNLQDVRDIQAGSDFMVALLNNGKLKVWGANTYGQLATGDTTSKTTPHDVAGIENVKEIAVGYSYVLALHNDGTIKSWGHNGKGQLGTGNTTDSRLPVSLNALTKVKKIAAGSNSSYAIDEAGAFFSWGDNATGELGLGDNSNRTIPTQVNPTDTFSNVWAGENHVVAITKDNTVKVSGYNIYGQLGLGDTTDRNKMTVLYGNTRKVLDVVSNDSNTYVLLEDGTVWTAGNNGSMMGLGDTAPGGTFTRISDLSGVKKIAVGGDYVLALLTNGTVMSWGTNTYGQLGNGTTSSRNRPAVIAGLNNVKEIFAQINFAFALSNDGTLKAWGFNGGGHLGLGDTANRLSPVQIPSLTGVSSLAAANNHVLVLTTGGTVKSWGANEAGQLGLGNTTSRTVPTDIPGLTGVSAVYAKGQSSYALLSNGTVSVWGNNLYGKLGTGDTSTRLSPASISTVSLPPVKSLVIQDYTVIAILRDGMLRAWGNNSTGQLGNGTASDSSNAFPPTTITGLSGIVGASISGTHVLAWNKQGSIFAWGSNVNGSLGLGHNTNTYIPTRINGIMATNAVTGSNQSFAISDGRLAVWGLYSNNQGLASSGSTANRSFPETISYLDEFKAFPQEEYQLKVQYKQGLPVTVRYYIDNETKPAESTTFEMPADVHTVTLPVNLKNLANGEHSLRFEVTDGLSTWQRIVKINIQARTLPPELITETTSGSIKTSIKLEGNNRDLGANPIRFTATASWGTSWSSNWISGRSVLTDRTVLSSNVADLGGAGTRKITVTANGKWIIPVYTTGTNIIQFMVSDDQGYTWAVLCTLIGPGISSNAAITAVGNTIFGVVRNGPKDISGFVFDSAKQTNENIASLLKPVDTNQTDIPTSGNVAITSADNSVQAVWVSKNAQYPSTYNIRYASIAEDGSALSVPEQVTANNGLNHTNPIIVLDRYRNPRVLFEQKQTIYPPSSFRIAYAVKTNGTWQKTEFDSSGLVAADPAAVIDKNNTMHVAWSHIGPDGYNKIYYKRLPETGSWSNTEILTASNFNYNQIQPALTVGQSNDVHLYYSGIDPLVSATKYNLRTQTLVDGKWSNAKTLTNATTSDITTPALAVGGALTYQDNPLVAYRDSSKGIVVTGSVQNEVSYTFTGFSPNTKFKVKMDIKHTDGQVTTVSKDVYTLAETPRLILENQKNGIYEFYVATNNREGTRYQLKAGNRFVNAEGNLTANPSWIMPKNGLLKVKGLTAGKSYSFQIRAVNEEGVETPFSSVLQIGPPPKAPNAPTGLKVLPSSTEATISWNAVSGATGYQVEVNGETIAAGNVLRYTKQSLVPNTVYTFRVRAEKDGLLGAWSSVLSVRTLMVAPSQPASPSAVATSKTVTVSWGAVSSVIQYELLWDGQLIAVGKQTNYQITELIPGTQHTYQVRAVSTGGTSGWTPMQRITTSLTVPNDALTLTVSAQARSVQLNWGASLDASGYEIEADGLILSARELNYLEIKGLTPSSNHTYKVRAFNEMGYGSWSAPVTVQTFLLETPVNIQEKITESEIELTWDSVPDATGYQVEADQVVQAAVNGKYIHNELAAESNHLYRVRATNASGTSAWSEPLSIQTLPVRPAIPSNISVVPGKNEVYITWGSVQGSMGYDIEIDGKVVVDAFNETKYTDTDLDTFSDHSYRIRARNASIAGEWSPLVKVRTLPDKPGLVQGINITSTNTMANVAWKADPTAIGYDIEVNGQIVDAGLKTAYTHRKVMAGTEHKYRLRMRNLAGVGEWSDLIVNNTLTARLNKGVAVDLGLTASNVTDFSKYTLVVNYDPNAIEVLDLSTLTGKAELTAGPIEGTDISIVQFTPGTITFVCGKSVLPGQAWSGVINSIKMKAKVNGGSSVTYTVFVK
ncbi:fibronectin type III domain-containing protein [Paenibacillus sp. GCM10027627]|uniref:RCC1 domain-containing protein n=1 Tax=unclassified Paenibacillus TaxID=185978 RepID=UPI003630E036